MILYSLQKEEDKKIILFQLQPLNLSSMHNKKKNGLVIFNMYIFLSELSSLFKIANAEHIKRNCA